ncbi:hypothetical protein NIES4071_03890 [Calothrix sp. NIES-4071]|nr:hypothetical protein NIES4071_03890 [Calothrix sp. NIES-4071]BAZ54735.1 hypothetical protein NIES4105_03880 [Calothrix sp. NIES-4105]
MFWASFFTKHKSIILRIDEGLHGLMPSQTPAKSAGVTL